MSKATKPPVGLRPTRLFQEDKDASAAGIRARYVAESKATQMYENQQRRIEIVEAIGRYTLAQVAIPKDWSEELMQLNSELA